MNGSQMEAEIKRREDNEADHLFFHKIILYLLNAIKAVQLSMLFFAFFLVSMIIMIIIIFIVFLVLLFLFFLVIYLLACLLLFSMQYSLNKLGEHFFDHSAPVPYQEKALQVAAIIIVVTCRRVYLDHCLSLSRPLFHSLSRLFAINKPACLWLQCDG